MATKNQKRPAQKKEKGVFKKSAIAQTDYQRERALAKARKRRQGNYETV